MIKFNVLKFLMTWKHFIHINKSVKMSLKDSVLAESLEELYPRLSDSDKKEIDEYMISIGKKMNLLVFTKTESALIILGIVIGSALIMVLLALGCRKCCCQPRHTVNQTIEFHSDGESYPNSKQQNTNQAIST